MVGGRLLMARRPWGIGLLAAVVVAGCANSAPSTPLAPDVQLPDTNKMSQDEINKLHSQGSSAKEDRAEANTPEDRRL